MPSAPLPQQCRKRGIGASTIACTHSNMQSDPEVGVFSLYCCRSLVTFL
jgi:hypothetical protein